ncbi:MAG: peptidyl-prolyl cis-trans isomerase [Verrucomicrobia bacterium]|nr:peptidyl-prolyl cis-trans isomerase [Verrucomicrobiota bacterium]
MIGTLRRHSQWLWGIIITVVIITFVVFFSPNVGPGQGRGEADYGTLYGQPIKRDDLAQAYSDAKLFFFLNTGQWPTPEQAMMYRYNLDVEARQRLLISHHVRLEGIEVGKDAVVQNIKDTFSNPETGVFNLQQYDGFTKQRLPAGGVTEAGFERYLKNELGRQQLARKVGLSGKLISTRAADGFFRRENEQALTEFVFLASSNNLAKVKLDDATLRAYHTNNLTSYRIPERARVHYVYLPYTNHNAEAEKELAANTNLTSIMEAYYTTNIFRYKDTNGTALTFAQARPKIHAEFRDEFATRIGQQKAGEFANELFKQDNKSSSLLTLAAKKGLAVKVTEPFTEFEGPKLTNAPGNFGRTAFQLTADEALGQMLPGTDGVYFIAFKERLKPEDPPFVQVRAKVTEEYQRSQATELTLTEGTKLVQAANDALAKGKSFKDAAKELGHIALEVPPFSRNAREIEIVTSRGVGVEEFRDQAFALGAGKVSSFRQINGGGFIVHVRSFQAATEDLVKAELPKFTDSLRENRANYAYREWLGREVERSGVMAALQPETKKGTGAGSGE